MEEVEKLIQINVLRDVEIAMHEVGLTYGTMEKVVSAFKFLEQKYKKEYENN
jgi:hypothetical protein